MNHETIGTAQRNRWLRAAMLLPLAGVAAASRWTDVLQWSAAAWGLWFLMTKVNQKAEPGRLLLQARAIFLTVLTGIAGSWLARGWEIRQENKEVAVILILMAAWTACGGIRKAAEVGTVLSWFITGGAAFLLIAGVTDSEMMLSESRPMEIPVLLPLLLVTPMLAETKGEEITKHRNAMLPVYLVAVTVSLLTAMAISPTEQLTGEKILLSWISGISTGRRPQRLEILTSVLNTLSWYCLFTWYLAQIRQCIGRAVPGKENRSVWIAAGIAVLYIGINVQTEGKWLVWIMTGLWAVIPLIKDLKNWRKKNVKKG